MKLLPASLAARTVLLVIAVVAVAEIATFALISQHRMATHMSQTVRFVGGQMRLLQSILPGLDVEARRRLSVADSDPQSLQLRPDSESVPARVPEFGFARHLAAELELFWASQ
ncbi:MAG: hypothetical protein IPP85_07810 [Propionivibrio sp.]|nr:hypothetical protein [Propionivibrio sp.]